jgi:hypothetical protein
MGLNNNVLEHIYKHKPDSFQWLKKYECVHFVDSFHSCTTEKSLLDDINTCYIELTNNDPTFSGSYIREHIMRINTKQLNFLDKYKKINSSHYSIKQHHDKYMNDDGTYPLKNVILEIPNNIINLIRKRSMCLYFNSEKPGTPGASGTNGIDIYIMAIFMENLIREKKTLLFNNITIVPRYPDIYPTILEKWIQPCRGSDFIRNTCLFSNTLYMQGLGVAGIDAASIPIIGLMTHLDNRSLRKYVKIPFFACGQQIVNDKLQYNTQDIIYYNKNIISQAEAISQTNLVSKARNNTVYNVCKYFHHSLRQLENMYSTFDIIS